MGTTEQEKNYVPEIGEKEYVGRATEKLPDGNSLPCANFCVAVTVHFPSISSLVNGGPNGPGPGGPWGGPGGPPFGGPGQHGEGGPMPSWGGPGGPGGAPPPWAQQPGIF